MYHHKQVEYPVGKLVSCKQSARGRLSAPVSNRSFKNFKSSFPVSKNVTSLTKVCSITAQMSDLRQPRMGIFGTYFRRWGKHQEIGSTKCVFF